MSSIATAGRTDTTARKIERSVFKYGNKYFMVPLLRAGLGRWLGSPLSGYFILLRTTGRKSGQPRYTPLNYAIEGGYVCCLAGFGEGTHWLANLRADPHVQVRLPGRTIEGIAEDVVDREEARRLSVRVARNCGFALVFENPRCLFMSDERLAAEIDGRPVVRIHPVNGPLIAGPYDPGGWGWLFLTLVQLTFFFGFLGVVRVLRRRAGRGGGRGKTRVAPRL